MQKSYYKREVKRYEELKDFYSKEEYENRIASIQVFNGNIPAFKRLAIIFEKQNQYSKAIEICNQAMEYYKNIEMFNEAAEFKNRKVKLLKKASKST